MNKSLKKWGLAINVIVIVAILAMIKAGIFYSGMQFISPSTLITAFLGGVIFLMGFLLAGTLSDYKESERIPSELAVSIKSLHEDFRLFLINHEKEREKIRNAIKDLLSSINESFRKNSWNQSAIDKKTNEITNNFIEAVKKHKELPATFFTKIRIETTNIERITKRISVIKKTSFIEAGYAIAEILTVIVIIIFLFLKIEPVYEAVMIQAIVSFILVYMVLLIKDMDDPFENGASFADVDLSSLVDLEEEWKKCTI